MTYVDDLHEPGDDREPEPDEFDESFPLDLEALPEAVGDDPQTIGMVEALISEVRALRSRVADFEALECREDWAVTDDKSEVPPPVFYRYRSADRAMADARRYGRQAWRRPLTVHAWEPIDSEAPF
jgi:hypothetical protein